MTEEDLQPETIRATSQPMVFVTRSSTREPDDIAAKMGDAFQILGDFLAENRVQPLGAPLAVYTEFSDEGMTMNIGVPVPLPALVNATGELQAGTTPSGRALRLAHRGPYAGLAAAYDAMRAYMRDQGLQSSLAWEIYRNDPATTPEDQLVTEIYMRLG